MQTTGIDWVNEYLLALSKLNGEKRRGKIFSNNAHRYAILASFTKGRIISEGNFGVFKSLKKRTKFSEGILPQNTKWVKK
jgi:hypothetical protein